MTKQEKLIARAKDLLQKLYSKLDAGSPMMDLLFDRMEEADHDRFAQWMDWWMDWWMD